MAANHKNSTLQKCLKLLTKIKEEKGDKDALHQFTRPVPPRLERSARKVRRICNIQYSLTIKIKSEDKNREVICSAL